MGNKIFNEDFFKRLNRLNMNFNIKLSKGYQGGRKSKAKGVSVEFSDFREYTPGDDFRRIDWNAYGRFDKLFIKVFMEEREGIFNFFVDTSKSMDYGESNKGTTALRVAGALSYIILNNLDRVNINTLNNGRLGLIKGGNGKSSFQRILKELEEIKFEGSTSLSDSIKKRDLSGKGLAIVISDFMNNNGLDELESGLKYLAFKKQEIILIQILSDEEIEPSPDSEVTLVDSETGEKIKMTLNTRVIKEYQKTLKNFNLSLDNLVKKYGGKLIQVKSSKSIEEIILSDLGENRVIY